MYDPSMSNGVATLEREQPDSFDPAAEVCEIAGILNVANARLVAVMETVLVDDSWQGPGVHTPAQWLACKAGISPERAKDIVRIARRRSSFPTLIDVFDAGQLSVEQVADGLHLRQDEPAFGGLHVDRHDEDRQFAGRDEVGGQGGRA